MADRRQVEKQKSSVVSAGRRMAEYEGGGGNSCLVLPKGVPLWQPKKEGEYTVDILPFRLTDKIKKFVAKRTRFGDPGDLYYEQSYHNHRGIGPDGNAYTCSAGTFNKPCPVCEFRLKAFKDPDRDADMEKLLKDLKPKERQLWLLWDHDDKKKGLQVWDISFYLFGQNLFDKIGRIKDPKRKAKADAFADPKRGSTLVIGAKEKSMGSNTFLEFADIQFEDRAEPVPAELVKKALGIDLSACVKEPEYKEVKKVFTTGLGGGGKKKDEDEDTEKEDEDEDEDLEGEDDADAEESDAEVDEGGVEGDDTDEEDDEAGEVAEEADEDEDGEAEAVTPKFKKGQTVLFKRKGKKLTGEIIGVKKDADPPFYRIQVEDFDKPCNVEYDEVLKKVPAPAADDDDEEEEKPAKKKGKKPKDEDDEFEEMFGGDDDEEEEKPAKKGKGKVKAGKKKPKEDDEEDDAFEADDDSF